MGRTQPALSSTVGDLCAFIDAAPTPRHAVSEAATRLTQAGFTELPERDRWPDGPGAFWVRRGGSLVAWRAGATIRPEAGLRIAGAHTDSPNLRLKPHPDTSTVAPWRQVSVEPYGGGLWNSWLDRDLGIAGVLVTTPSDNPETTEVLVRVDEPWLRIPQLAIHLDRTVNTDGLRLDPQRHLSPVWGLGGGPGVVEAVAAHNGVDPDSVVAWDLMLFDETGACVTGANGEFVASARIDNLASCWAAIEALVATPEPTDIGPLPMVSLFDHEEVGSVSASGAGSTLAADVVERLACGAALDVTDTARLRSATVVLSCDGAHATHPNWPERHDPTHPVVPGGGVVVKHNVNQRYATDAAGTAWLRQVASDAGVALQDFVMRNDMPCGSTIGPVTAAGLGATTIDVGVPQLAMHSVREMCSTSDALALPGLVAAAFTSAVKA